MRIFRCLLLPLLMLTWVSSRADTIHQTTDSDFYGGTMTGMSVVNTGVDAYLSLQSNLQQVPGNGFVITGATNHPLYNTHDRLDIPFSAPKYMTVTAVIIFNYWQGTTGSYTCGIRQDIDLSGTSPNSFAWLGSGTYNTMSNILASGQSYYSYVQFSAPAYLSAGVPYHIGVMVNGGVDNMNFCRPRGTSPNYRYYPYSGAADAFQKIMFSMDDGTDWTSFDDSQPVFLIEYLDPNSSFTNTALQKVSYIGNPYYSYVDRNIYGNNYIGQEFSVFSDTSLSKLRIYTMCNSSKAPSDDLRVGLQDITDPLNELPIEDDVFVGKNNIFSSFSWQSYTLATPRQLSAGHKYRIYFRSQNSDSNNYYIIRSVYVYQNPQQESVISTQKLASATYGGSDSYLVYSVGAGSAWDNYNMTQDMLMLMSDSVFSMYTFSGEMISRPFDTRDGSSFTKIWWLPQSQNPLTGAIPIKVQIAANNDDSTWNFAGPDGTSSTWFTDPCGSQALSGLFGNKRYVRYKVDMATANANYSPFVTELNIDYSARPDAPGDINLTNYPNPFNPRSGQTVIKYTLYGDSDVEVRIATPLLEPVRTWEIKAGLDGGQGSAGGFDNRLYWDGKNGGKMFVESGAYICVVKVKATGKSFIRKIAVVK
jgi:hypothetical protein